jgi:hypothetical protein
MAPEYDWPGVIIGMSKHLVELYSKSVQMTDVQRTKVRVKSVV